MLVKEGKEDTFKEFKQAKIVAIHKNAGIKVLWAGTGKESQWIKKGSWEQMIKSGENPEHSEPESEEIVVIPEGSSPRV